MNNEKLDVCVNLNMNSDMKKWFVDKAKERMFRRKNEYLKRIPVADIMREALQMYIDAHKHKSPMD